MHRTYHCNGEYFVNGLIVSHRVFIRAIAQNQSVMAKRKKILKKAKK